MLKYTKFIVVETKFSCLVYEDLTGKEKERLSDAAQDLFNFISIFAIYH